MNPFDRVQTACTCGRSSQAITHFHRERMPAVADVLRLLEVKPMRPNRSGYAQVCCPIHGEIHPSLSVHLARGNWRCVACGASGGDILELYGQVRHLSFVEAACELAYWGH
ncbi:CHC2 zinc finger domain-containing protein [Paraburkholderia azotifigens]|uniref:CHC2 zinc finger domain-containing protein n=1 Tax=Paraburkholderia azotifigens TaxID=2057004 RepID=A0ABU9R3P0_9BURK